MHIVGTTERGTNRPVYECERFKQFFTLPNFIDLAGLEQLQSLQANIEGNAAQATYELESWPLERR